MRVPVAVPHKTKRGEDDTRGEETCGRSQACVPPQGGAAEAMPEACAQMVRGPCQTRHHKAAVVYTPVAQAIVVEEPWSEVLQQISNCANEQTVLGVISLETIVCSAYQYAGLSPVEEWRGANNHNII
ncbi:hypothetical protein AAFF_G00101120 [Aldrovandia affinis]|uniref:Uncharacterized protein n=1 Tax=Aldrovandia affinis TaxID=143900 RepID=A0AAD7WB88_9TELE|nr:hypothetical protein AAFF_G00101120 [Aldrovandia affinis]